MSRSNRKLLIEQLDKKFNKFSALNESDIPHKGWIHAIRTAMNMSLAQLANRLNKTVPTVKEIEEREETKSITLNKLMEVAEVLGFRFVYGFIPKDSSLENMIEKRANEIAHKIVMRTSHTMKLEDQENRQERLDKAISDRVEIIKQEMPRYLWD